MGVGSKPTVFRSCRLLLGQGQHLAKYPCNFSSVVSSNYVFPQSDPSLCFELKSARSSWEQKSGRRGGGGGGGRGGRSKRCLVV